MKSNDRSAALLSDSLFENGTNQNDCKAIPIQPFRDVVWLLSNNGTCSNNLDPSNLVFNYIKKNYEHFGVSVQLFGDDSECKSSFTITSLIHFRASKLSSL
ncbi:hypothetical protein QL285_028686 [Trifolium repens]|nr:hypothetical protein QL285_028686 [Trifolium repens]